MNKTNIARLIHRCRACSLFRTLANALFDPYRPELHYMRGPGPKWRAKHRPAVTTMIRKSHPIGQCTLSGELIEDTAIRYDYRRRFGDALDFVDKRSPTIHSVL